MAAIAVCVHSTEANDRLKYTKESLMSLVDTVDFNKHKIFIINNRSSDECADFLSWYARKGYASRYWNLKENIGTARGINLAIKERLPGEVVIKCDDDVLFHQSGWVEELEQGIAERTEIGILGLKRDDVYGEFTEDGKYLVCDDIMGTCTAFNPTLLDKVGFILQPSVYGFDDVIMSARSIAAGFKNAFLPHIKITHLDDGKNPYCDWKKREAALYLNEVSSLINLYKTGKLNPYDNGE